MWASEAARNGTILAMLAETPAVLRLWTKAGPGEEAHRLLDLSGGYLSSGERVLLKAAFDIWNGCGHCEVSDLLATLDAPRLLAVARAIAARDLP